MAKIQLTTALFAIIASFLMVFTGCTTIATDDAIVCNNPYIRVGKECCLDANLNNICDKDEAYVPVTDNDESSLDGNNYEVDDVNVQYSTDLLYDQCVEICGETNIDETSRKCVNYCQDIQTEEGMEGLNDAIKKLKEFILADIESKRENSTIVPQELVIPEVVSWKPRNVDIWIEEASITDIYVSMRIVNRERETLKVLKLKLGDQTFEINQVLSPGERKELTFNLPNYQKCREGQSFNYQVQFQVKNIVDGRTYTIYGDRNMKGECTA